jgi:hypothetical protein
MATDFKPFKKSLKITFLVSDDRLGTEDNGVEIIY